MNDAEQLNTKSSTKPRSYSYASTGFNCPVCGSSKTRVIDKENGNLNGNDVVRRRKECENKHRFSTIEMIGQQDSYTSRLMPQKKQLSDQEILEKIPRVKDSLLTHINFKELIKSIYNL